LGHPCKFQLVSRLGSVTARHLVVGVSQTVALNRGHHLYSTGRPSRWALAHISSFLCTNIDVCNLTVKIFASNKTDGVISDAIDKGQFVTFRSLIRDSLLVM